ncbi:hypothetical protein DT250_04255 [Bacillus sp. AR2-1]|uniref:G1 family glutamic endopeptidase n=1 Tax=Bacillus sp. AR2-1 TaxID=2217816 RepID=UPI0011F0677B|nr:G1 family glutamic endopeptidase [Bacillus sp. AR2-1]KAA0776193.1 hypothetical protein DT250_04255 [Bacillus sp. AR2-1]
MTWSLNYWAGYIKFPVSGYTSNPSISAKWNVPEIQATPVDSNAQVLVWVGIGGGKSLFGAPDVPRSGVIQAGIGADYDSSGNPEYFAFWETFPANPEQRLLPLSQYKVKPLDDVGAQIFFSNTGWDITIWNYTQNWSFHQSGVPYTGDKSTFNFIVEAPLDSSYNPVPLPQFYGVVTFRDCTYTNGNPNFDYNIDRGFMTDPKNPSKIICNSLNPFTTGDGFSVVWGTAPAPAPMPTRHHH